MNDFDASLEERLLALEIPLPLGLPGKDLDVAVQSMFLECQTPTCKFADHDQYIIDVYF
jgi:hypothetical protein